MKVPAEFDEIRPYNPEELPQVFDELFADPMFKAVVSKVMPNVPLDALEHKIRQCKTNLEVQLAIFYKFIHDILKEHSDGFEMVTTSLPDKTANYTFISNHRDIVLDPGLISVGLVDNKFPNTVEIAIGDNLLIYPWIKKLVRINKSFIVLRGLTMRQQLAAAVRMSKYIHFAVTQKNENVWIAQREGRAKDSDDRTQESVLKMLAMGGEGSPVDKLKELNIVPISLSYEYDPCDFLKAKEMQQKRDIEGFKKSRQDDLDNMQTGIFGYKGRVHFQTASCINDKLEEMRDVPKTEFFTHVAQLIDKEIHSNYKLYPCNYIAYDLIENTDHFKNVAIKEGFFEEEEKEKFKAYLQKKLSMIDLPNRDDEFIINCMLTMYANPVRNQLKALEG